MLTGRFPGSLGLEGPRMQPPVHAGGRQQSSLNASASDHGHTVIRSGPVLVRRRPFNYFTYGAAATEVELDVLTGDFQARLVVLLSGRPASSHTLQSLLDSNSCILPPSMP